MTADGVEVGCRGCAGRGCNDLPNGSAERSACDRVHRGNRRTTVCVRAGVVCRRCRLLAAKMSPGQGQRRLLHGHESRSSPAARQPDRRGWRARRLRSKQRSREDLVLYCRAGTAIRVQVEIHIQMSGRLFETWTWEDKGDRCEPNHDTPCSLPQWNC